MIQLQKYRTLTVGNTYEVYRNLNKGNFSIRCRKNKLVSAIGDKFLISDVTPKISEKGRQRVLVEKSKNVHSVLIGTYLGEVDINTDSLDELYYNPYTLGCFINKRTGEKVKSVSKVYFSDNKAWIVED